MAARKFRGGAFVSGMHSDQTVEKLIVVGQVQTHGVFGKHVARGLRRGFVEILQAFQPEGALAAERACGRGHAETHFARAGHHDAHAVLEKIGAHGHVHAFWRPAEFLGRAGRAQGHGDGLRAAERGHDFLVQQRKKDGAFLFVHAHGYASFLCWSSPSCSLRLKMPSSMSVSAPSPVMLQAVPKLSCRAKMAMSRATPF